MSIRACNTRVVSQLSLMLGVVASAGLVGCSDPSGPHIEGRAIYAVTGDDHLLLFGSEAPGTILRDKAITGVTESQRIIAIDFRPADAQLYGLGSDSRIYAINTETGAATAIGAAAFTPTLDGTHFGFDFNPTVDRVRTGSLETMQNLRLNPATGAVAAEDSDFEFVLADVNDGDFPTIAGLAYTNSVSGATTTVLYGIDQSHSALVRLPLPNNGGVSTIGALGVTSTEKVGFDIDPSDNTAYASLTPGLMSSLYTVNLDTGAATLIGAIGGGTPVEGIAVAP